MIVTTWTEERITELKRLYTTNSAAEIAAALGGGLTRCAIIGKARRLGLALPVRVKVEPKPRSPRVPRNRSGEHHAILKVVHNGGGGLKLIQSRASEMPELRCAPVVPLNLSLADVGNGCRYIQGNDHLYCGHPPFMKDMCRPHFELCWIPPAPKRDQARKSFGPDFAKRSA